MKILHDKLLFKMVYDYKNRLLRDTINKGKPYHLLSIFRFAVKPLLSFFSMNDNSPAILGGCVIRRFILMSGYI